MKIQQEDNGKKGEFFIEIDGNRDGLMTYTWAGDDKLIIDHTEVGDSLRGKGVGYKLVAASVEFARTQNIKILPLCPFAKSVFDKKPEYSDVLA
ncbi:GNAT family N-acetyltransferase [Tenacibaculum sp. 1_MG-2023]|uniref:GNAT family N-acetyltransferase n=1 Tax=Tenacibaculum sp. 1_MG-2023 TaxID=3062653 RepID=UPI0026E407F4|nr:GNAT family N-acetyltransferase [Tenacibaculum sp. 1_MG-2023]MDO6676135.1 GNAT family N-acetyltransferase [Tenacibaculum sp. 1_MG-2023]